MTPDLTPQPAHDHGAAGFCGNHAQPPDERTETVARVLYAELNYALTPETPNGIDVLAALADKTAAAVVAALDDESARLRASADAWWSEYDRELQAHEATKAEVERLTRIVNGYDRTPAEQRAADAEAERDAARAALDRVRALVAKWQAVHDGIAPALGHPPQGQVQAFAADLRAALDPEEPR